MTSEKGASTRVINASLELQKVSKFKVIEHLLPLPHIQMCSKTVVIMDSIMEAIIPLVILLLLCKNKWLLQDNFLLLD